MHQKIKETINKVLQEELNRLESKQYGKFDEDRIIKIINIEDALECVKSL